MKIKKLYKNGKKKALTLSYDDGSLDDVKMIEILNKYSLKCTFNLNSSFVINKDKTKEMSFEQARNIYKGHEIASHTYSHKNLTQISLADAQQEIKKDKQFLESVFAKKIKGFVFPYSIASTETRKIVAESGFKYIRQTWSTYNFELPKDFNYWRITVSHGETCLDEVIDRFLLCEQELALFYMMGHSWQFSTDNNWDKLENFCKKVSSNKDIWFATNGEIYEYINAMNQLVITENGIINNSKTKLWLQIDQEVREV